ncbi:hypothetical protein CGCTS75_v010452 [Colletotrichum tropicale]|nr:hypothetical protein CGCTS75_v010452 [Colletotrichum tropicale]
MDGDEDAADAGGGMIMIPSQASSHFPIEPVSADVLLRRETKRRDALKKRGPVRVGCREVDEYVLMGGGLERGSVVGISAESEQMGLMISLQAVAAELCGSEGEMSRAMVVTAQPPAAILPALRDAVKAELAARGVAGAEVRGRLVSCLERVSITRVFDLEGLWEVLGDLDIPPGSPVSEAASLVPEMEEDPEVLLAPQGQEEETASLEPERITLPDLKPVYEPQRRPVRTEIADSEEEDGISDGDVSDSKDNDVNDRDYKAPAPSSSELSDLSPPPSSMASMLATPDPAAVPEDKEESDSHDDPNAKQEERPPTPRQQPAEEQNRSRSPRREAEPEPEPPAPPDMILITHFSTLMTALFTGRDRPSAHDGLQSLSAFLRYLSRSLSSSPLIILLNSTSSSKSRTLTEPPPIPPSEAPPPPDERSSSSSKPLAATLRSVFNPPQLDIPGYASHAAARRNKPTFGLVFAQLLDLHLLCTKVPRTRKDAERLYAPPARDDGGGGGVRYTWVVEVLLDELGVWEERAAQPGVRRCREQRWTAVDVRAGRVVDAFEGAEGRPKNVGDVRVVGGFGGPRV